MEDSPLPGAFIRRLRHDIGDMETEAFIAALGSSTPVSIRFNPFKIGEKPEGKQVAWSRYGFYLDQRPVFTADPLFHGGAYYVQEASSMFLEHIFRTVFPDGEPIRILDLCAAPGGKTTHLASLAGLESFIVANETIRARARTLAENVQKWGLGNVTVTNNDPKHFTALNGFFDLVVVDAPCSGEGMFRKTPEARREWSEANVDLCISRQRRILADVWDAIKPGGILIYSTCTFNHSENEGNIRWIVENYDCEPIDIPVNPAWNIEINEIEGIRSFRFYPHRTEGEGFFVAVLRKGGKTGRQNRLRSRKAVLTELSKSDRRIVDQWFGQPEFMRFGVLQGNRIFGYYADHIDLINAIADSVNFVYSGVEAGQMMGKKLKPEHSLALFHDLDSQAVPNTDLDLYDALRYLRKEEVPADRFQHGLNLITYENLPIGWIKRIGNRCNNMYPKEWRILHV